VVFYFFEGGGEVYWGKYLVVFGFFNNTLLAALLVKRGERLFDLKNMWRVFTTKSLTFIQPCWCLNFITWFIQKCFIRKKEKTVK